MCGCFFSFFDLNFGPLLVPVVDLTKGFSVTIQGNSCFVFQTCFNCKVYQFVEHLDDLSLLWLLPVRSKDLKQPLNLYMTRIHCLFFKKIQ